MKDIFLDKVSSNSKSQGYWLEDGGYSQACYSVEFEGDQVGGTVYIFDWSQTGPDQLAYTFHFSSIEVAEAFATLMEREVNNWSAPNFYGGENPAEEGQRDIERETVASVQQQYGRGY